MKNKILDELRIGGFPKVGDKLKASVEFPEWFYPHFRDMVEDGNQNITPNQEYTVNKVGVYSSWCGVWLEELPNTLERPDRYFNLVFFEWDYDKQRKKHLMTLDSSLTENLTLGEMSDRLMEIIKQYEN